MAWLRVQTATALFRPPRIKAWSIATISRLLLQPPAELHGHFHAGTGQLGAFFDEAGNDAPPAKLGSSAMLLDVIRALIVNISDRFEEPIQQCGGIFRCRIAFVGNLVLMRVNTGKGPAVAGRDRAAIGLQILRAAFKDGLRRKPPVSDAYGP